jgi:hypothetical protein
MEKISLNESDLRKIVRRVLKRKLNEDAAKSNPDSEESLTKDKNDSVLNTDKIKNVVEKSGIDGLAGTTSRGKQIGEASATALVAGGVAAGTASYLGSIGVGLAAMTPLGIGLVSAAALGAGLYYVFSDTEVKSEAVLQALDATLYTKVASAFKEMKAQLRKSENEEIRTLAKDFTPEKILAQGILGPTEKRTLVDEMYTATQGGYTFGIGTDKGKITEIIKKCKSYLGVSQLSALHAQKKGGIIDEGNLLKVLRGELNTSDFDTYVTAPLEELPYIFIGNNSYTKEEFLDWVEDTKIKLDKLIESKKEEKPAPGEGEKTVENYVKEIQKLLNQYCADKDLDYTPIKPDGLWGSKTNKLWLNPYLPHVFENHPEFSGLDLEIGNGRWKSISDQLIGTFPGYTSGEIGCYRFCVDALAGNTSQGKLDADPDEKPIKYYGGRSGKKKGGESKVTPKEEPSPTPVPTSQRSRSDGRLDYRNIIIDVDIVGQRDKNTIDSLPGAQKGDAKELAYDFLGNFASSRLNLKNQEVFQLDVVFKGKDKVSIKNSKGTRLFKNAKIRRFKETFIRYFSSLDQEKIKALGVDKKNPMTISIKMPKGVYTAATERLHETIKARKILKRKLKELKRE